jgi:heme-degrading monooxygenase HmoA
MYARVATLKIGAEGVEASIRYFREVALPGSRAMPGFQGATLLINRDDHLAQSTTYWDTPGHLQASDEPARAVRQELMDRIEGVEVVSVEAYEVAVDETAVG